MEKVAPIFDTGQAMNSQKEYLSYNFFNGYGKLFTNTHCDFEKLLPLVHDITRFDVSKLKPIIQSWKELLVTWQPVTKMDNSKITALVDGLQMRTEKFEKYEDKNFSISKDTVKAKLDKTANIRKKDKSLLEEEL